MSVDDVLAAYLESGSLDDDQVAALDPDSRAEVRAALADLDRLRLGLAAADTWIEPGDDLEERVVAAVARHDPRGARRHRAPTSSRRAHSTTPGCAARASSPSARRSSRLPPSSSP
jgi:hypothetical protein